MTVKTELSKIVRPENFFDDPEVINSYSRDFSLVPPGVPNYVVKPKTTEEVQKVIQLANKNLLPVVPVSSSFSHSSLGVSDQPTLATPVPTSSNLYDVPRTILPRHAHAPQRFL